MWLYQEDAKHLEKAIHCYDYKSVQDGHFCSAENDTFVKKRRNEMQFLLNNSISVDFKTLVLL